MRCYPNLVWNSRRQGGAALIIALFLIVVVAALGVFAVTTDVNNQQTATLALTEARVTAAAYSGLEYGSYKARTAGTCGGGWTPVALTGNPPGTQGITVQIQCQSIPAPNGTVYRLTARAFCSTYGRPDFVQRTLDRRVNKAGTQTW